MKDPGRIRPFARVLAAIVVASGLVHALPQESREAPAQTESRAESRPADLSAAAMTARIRGLLPHVEKVLGAPMPGPPVEVVVSGRREIEALAFETAIMISCAIEGVEPSKRQREDWRRQARGVSRTIVALVHPPRDSIRIVPTNFREPPDQGLLDLILIHEAVHVFQNRALGLNRSLALLRSLDGFMGLQAVVEGHAEWVTHEIARRLGREADFARHRRQLDEIPEDVADDPVEADRLRLAVEVYAFAYLEGERFVDAVVRKTGYDAAVSRMFRDPPRSQHSVRRPSEYLDPPANAFDPVELGRRLRGLFPPETKPQAAAAHEGLIRAAMGMLDKATVDAAMDGYRGGSMAVAQDGTERNDYASILVWTTAQAAAKWIEASLAAQKKKDEAAANIVESAEYSEPETIDGITYVFVKKKIDAGRDEPIETLLVLARKDEACTELGGMDPATPRRELKDRARRILTEVLDPAGAGSRPAAPVDPPGEDELSEAASREALPPVIRVQGKVAYSTPGPALDRVEVTLRSLGDETRPVQLATGAGGRFEVDLPTGVPTRVGLIAADGDLHDDHVGRRFRVRPGRVLELEIKREPMVTVRVVDAVTSRPVKGARVHRSASWRSWADPDDAFWVPSRRELDPSPELTDEAGLVRIRRNDSNREVPATGLLVVDPAHSWRYAKMPAAGATGEVVVAVSPGGALKIEIEGWADLADPTVSLQRAVVERRKHDFSYPDEIPAPDKNGAVLVEGLPPGTYGIVIARGPFHKDGPLYGTAICEVRSGEVTRVPVSVKGGPAGHTVRGRLSVPEGYREAGRELTLKLVGAGPETVGTSLEATCKLASATRKGPFTFEKVIPGRWTLVVEDLQWRRELDTRSEAGDLDLEVPEPGDLELKVIDKVTGDPVRRATARWRVTTDLKEWGSIEGRWDGKDEIVRLRAAPGAGVLSVTKKLYKESELKFTLQAGGRISEVVSLVPAGEVTVRLRLGGKPFEGEAEARLTWPSSSENSRRLWRGVVTFNELDSGSYTLSLDPIAGYKPVANRGVEVVAGKAQTIDIELEKAE